MTEQAAGQGILDSLGIDAQPLYEGQLDVLFTGLGSGGPLSGAVTMLTQHVTDLRDALTKAAAAMTPVPLGAFGRPEQPRVIFDLVQGGGSGLQFVYTVAYATGEEGYVPPSLSAPVTSAALTRLADGLDQILQGGSGVANWVPAE